MLQTLLGLETFRRGFDHYIAKNDGGAATLEAFLEAMQEAAGRDLGQFALWFSQAGTPLGKIETRWDDVNHPFTLSATQTTPATPGQPIKRPFLIPLDRKSVV